MPEKKPAIEGGKPERKKFLVFCKPFFEKEEITEVVNSLESGWVGFGPKTKKFEEEFREYIGCKNSISVNSCTSALFLSLKVLGIKKGDEVITSPLTFASTANVIEHLGAKPVFADVEKSTGLIDAEKIEEKISDKTKCILPVHLCGRPCEMDKIMEIAEKNSLFVVEDAAHSIEAEFKGKKIGSIGDFTCFSFYTTKNITSVEGGMITTNKDDLTEEIKLLRCHGINDNAWDKFNSNSNSPYNVLSAGYNMCLTDLQASIALPQLKRVESNLKKRKKLLKIYLQELEGIKELTLMDYSEKNIKHANHLFTVLLNSEKLRIDRNKFLEAMKKENIGTGIHFISLHLTDYYGKKYGYSEKDFPNALFISDRTFSLPLGPNLSEKDVLDAVNAVKKIINFYRK